MGGQGSWSFWQEGVESVSTEDVLAVRERGRWTQHSRGGRGTRQTGPALDKSHDDLCGSAGGSIQAGKNFVSKILAPKSMACQSQERMFVASRSQVEPW